MLLDYIFLYFTFLFLIFFRYVAVSYLFYFIFYVLKFDEFKGRKINSRLRKPKQSQKELWRSFWASSIFALGSVALIFLYRQDLLSVYFDPSKYSYSYLIISFLGIMFIHDTYYYWLHRWMHRPGVYQHVHIAHHDSIVTSPWTSFAFDPIESLLQAVFLPVVMLFIPLHIGVIAALLFVMTVSATINHLDIEIYPKNFHKHFIGKWIIGATHHSLHHTEFITNYGLYFTFWDRWMNTESKKFEKLFERATQQD